MDYKMKRFLKYLFVCLCFVWLPYAEVLDSKDVKMTNMQGLGGNPALIGYAKKSSVELGTVVLQQLAQNSKVLSYPTLDKAASGTNKASASFNDAPRYFKYAFSLGKDNWFAVKHYYDSTVYPYYAQKLDANNKFKYSLFKKEATETLSFIFSREIAKDLIGGIEIGSNTYTSEKSIDYNKDAGKDDVNTFITSTPYYSLQLGLVKIIDPANKFMFVHKIAQNRGLFVRDYNSALPSPYVTYTDIEVVPNETSVGYTHNFTKNFELGAYYKYTWGASYTTDRKGSNVSDQVAVTKYPFGNLTVAADYGINDKLSLQSYYVYIRNYKQIEYKNAATNKDDMDRGWKICQLGGNVQYKVIPDGTMLIGAYNTQQLSEDNSINWKFDQTVTYVSWSQNL